MAKLFLLVVAVIAVDFVEQHLPAFPLQQTGDVARNSGLLEQFNIFAGFDSLDHHREDFCRQRPQRNFGFFGDNFRARGEKPFVGFWGKKSFEIVFSLNFDAVQGAAAKPDSPRAFPRPNDLLWIIMELKIPQAARRCCPASP